MENNKNKKSVKFQGDMLIFCDFIQVFVFTRNHHLKLLRDKAVKWERCRKGIVGFYLNLGLPCHTSRGV